jgi:imidazole glycerol-phosphate synthase subunit HisH
LIAVVDYGMGNLGSVANALRFLSLDFFIARNPEDLKKAGRIILPGVGAFGKAMENLKGRDFTGELHAQVKEGKPFLGICLGLQLLFESSSEGGTAQGLGMLKGSVVKFMNTGLKVPHMGWNSIHTDDSTGLLHGFNGEYVYFVHSYYPVPGEPLIKTTSAYGVDFTAAVEKDNILACQFHPEKSGKTGLAILKGWAAK